MAMMPPPNTMWPSPLPANTKPQNTNLAPLRGVRIRTLLFKDPKTKGIP